MLKNKQKTSLFFLIIAFQGYGAENPYLSHPIKSLKACLYKYSKPESVPVAETPKPTKTPEEINQEDLAFACENYCRKTIIDDQSSFDSEKVITCKNDCHASVGLKSPTVNFSTLRYLAIRVSAKKYATYPDKFDSVNFYSEYISEMQRLTQSRPQVLPDAKEFVPADVARTNCHKAGVYTMNHHVSSKELANFAQARELCLTAHTKYGLPYGIEEEYRREEPRDYFM